LAYHAPYGDGRIGRIETVEGDAFALAAARTVDATDATSADRDNPYENAFANLRASHQLWRNCCRSASSPRRIRRLRPGDRRPDHFARFTSTSQFAKSWSPSAKDAISW
jgi:hypothetical protein